MQQYISVGESTRLGKETSKVTRFGSPGQREPCLNRPTTKQEWSLYWHSNGHSMHAQKHALTWQGFRGCLSRHAPFAEPCMCAHSSFIYPAQLHTPIDHGLPYVAQAFPWPLSILCFAWPLPVFHPLPCIWTMLIGKSAYALQLAMQSWSINPLLFTYFFNSCVTGQPRCLILQWLCESKKSEWFWTWWWFATQRKKRLRPGWIES